MPVMLGLVRPRPCAFRDARRRPGPDPAARRVGAATTFLLAVAVPLVATTCHRGNDRTAPHIFLVTSDALRFDHLSINGYGRATSPHIDRFCGESWHFTNAVTVVPKTGPSFATLFSGRHPEEHGVRSNFDGVPEALPLLAERLRSLGYATAAFVGNPVLRAATGFTRGFDHYVIFDGKHQDGVRSVNEAFFAWARARAWDRPAFVWLHYMDPHGPYAPPAPLVQPFLDDELARSDERLPPAPPDPPGGNRNKVRGAIPEYQLWGDERRVASYVARYDGEIRYMDAAFGEFLAFAAARGLLADGAVVFTSDHGESLGEDGFYFEHGWFAHEPALKVPLAIKPPGRAERRIVTAQASNLDLFPTLLALAGSTDEGGGDGSNLLAPLAERPPLLIANADLYPESYRGLRSERWKYLVRTGDGAEWLFDLERDPHETRNLAESEANRLAELRRLLVQTEERLRAAAVPRSAARPDDPETLNRLRSLGYVD